MGGWAIGAIALAVFFGWEVFWRRRGFIPWVTDDWSAWALARCSSRLKGNRAVALVGASRLQVGLRPDILKDLTGQLPVMLAVDGCPPLAVLADLAGDPAFCGTVICSFTPAFLAGPGNDRDRSAKWVRKSRAMSAGARGFWFFWVWCQGSLACLSPDLTPSKLLEAVKSGTWPVPHRAPMSPDRSRVLDYGKADVAALRKARERREQALAAGARPLPGAGFAERLEDIAESVDALEERGGRVVFIRLPSSGAVREIERQTWPRERYWDLLAASSRARSIHFGDCLQLSAFTCRDGSHLGAEDARRFSRALVEVLQGEGREGIEHRTSNIERPTSNMDF